MRESRAMMHFGVRATSVAVACVLLMAGCATQPEPELDPFDAAARHLRAQLEQIDGIADVRQVISMLDLSISYSITDPARAEQVTLDVIDTYKASDMPEALKKETAAYSYDAQLVFNIIEVGYTGDGPLLEIPFAQDTDAATVARGVAAWTRMGAIDGVEMRQSTFSPSGFELAYSVDYGGLLDGVRPTSVTPQLSQIIAESGFDPSASSIKAALDVPEVLNSVDGERKYVQGTTLSQADQPLTAVAGPNYGSALYFIPGQSTMDIVVVPKLAPDGTLLPLDLTAESVLAAGQVIQADIKRHWTLRNVIVFTQDGSQTYSATAS